MVDHNVVRSLLRPSEFVRAALEGAARLPEAGSHAAITKGDSDAIPGEYSVLLVVVGHLDNTTGEAGGVFVYRVQESPSSSRPELILEQVYPIHGNFSLGLSQVVPSIVVSDADISSVPAAPAESGLCIELSNGQSEPFIVLTHDKEHLSSVLLACRRFRELSLRNPSESGSYPWLAPYALHPSSWLSVTPPRDLRDTSVPLHTRLSEGCAGLPGDDVADYMAIRDDWLYTQTRLTVQRDIEQKKLRIRAGTFNVNGKMPSQDLSAWIRGRSIQADENEVWEQLIPPLKKMAPLSLDAPSSKPTSPMPTSPKSNASHLPSDEYEDPDLLVLAFQELDLSTGALLYSLDTTREDAWTAAVLAALGEKGEYYEKLISKQLVGMLIIVFVSKKLRKCFLGARTGAVGAGLMGIMGNKGATAVRLTYRPEATLSIPSPTPTTLTFVNAHLAAFDEMLDRRNADYRDIARRLEFGPCAEYMWSVADAETGLSPPMLNIFSSDVLVWMVHLNYRINLPDSDVRHFLSHNAVDHGIPTLLPFDQLKGSMRNKKAFEGFTEHPITFPPTYRFNSGLLADSLGYDMKRKPAWTDRIMHMSSTFTPIQQLSYTSHQEVTLSDHRPISADFIVEAPIVDTMVIEAIANDLHKSVADTDPEELTSPPALKLDETSLDFGKISYERPISGTLMLNNVGKVPAAFRFYPHEIDGPIHPDWLQISPLTGFILPGDSISLTFTIHVTRKTAARLNIRIEEVASLIILHTTLGQDLFISLSGHYEPTCFGNSLSILTRLPGPIRELKSEEDLMAETQSRNSSREMMKLMNWLMSNDVESVDDLFFSVGEPKLVEQIRECLDTNTDFPVSPESSSGKIDAGFARAMATALLIFLDSLPEPVVPTFLHVRCAEVPNRDAAYEMLSSLPPASVNVWISVTAFLHLLSLQAPKEKPASLPEKEVETEASSTVEAPSPSKAEQLATIFSSVLLRDDIEATVPVSLLEKRRFLLYFMEG